VRRPRIPVWVVATGTSERSMARAARWDGLVTQVSGAAELAPITAFLDRARPSWRADGFELVAQGSTPADPAAAAAIVGPWADAGATWWIDADWEGATVASQHRRIEAGPPRP
jgi:hypothetical protein